MSAIAEPVLHAMHDDALARRNALLLAAAQAAGCARTSRRNDRYEEQPRFARLI